MREYVFLNQKKKARKSYINVKVCKKILIKYLLRASEIQYVKALKRKRVQQHHARVAERAGDVFALERARVRKGYIR